MYELTATQAAILGAIIFIIFDFVSGIAKALKNKELSSSKMREGLFHKGGFIAVIVLAFALDFMQNYLDLGFTVPLTGLACAYIILTETASIIENIGELAPELKNSKILELFKSDKEV